MVVTGRKMDPLALPLSNDADELRAQAVRLAPGTDVLQGNGRAARQAGGTAAAGTRIGLQPQPLGLQRNRAPAGEGIEHGRRLWPTGRLDLSSGLRQQLGVVGVLPRHQALHQIEQLLALGLLLGRGESPVAGRIIHQRREQHRPTRRQRLARPPDVQRRRMPAPNRLLFRRRGADRIQRQRHLDQLPLVHHAPFSPTASPNCSPPNQGGVPGVHGRQRPAGSLKGYIAPRGHNARRSRGRCPVDPPQFASRSGPR